MYDYQSTAQAWAHDDPLPWWQWLKEEPVVIIEENELPAWKDAEQIYQVLRAMGANHVRYPAVCWGAHFYKESQSLPKFFTLDPGSDYFGDVSECMKKHGAKVMAYCHYGVLYRELEELHPDWLAVKSDGSYWIWQNIHRMACLSSDTFVEAMRTAIQEVIERYEPDSIYLDGPAWYHSDCHCEWCKRKYRDAFGEPLPDTLSVEDGSLPNYQRHRDTVHLDVVKGIHELTQSAEIPLQINTSMHHTQAHRQGCMENAMTHCEGANTTEVNRSSRFSPIVLSAKLGESLKRVSMAYCPPGPYESLRTHNFPETLVTGIGYAMHGGTFMLQPGICYFHDETGGPIMRKLTETISNNREIYYRTQPVKELALVLNNMSFDTLHPSPHLGYLKRCFLGAFEALCHGHRHFDCMLDAQLSTERLKGYKALLLPIATYLDDHQEKALRGFVADGGVVIVGPETSLYDAKGERRSDFALADFLGVSFVRENDKSVIHTREYRESAHIHPFAPIPEAYIRLVDDLPGMDAATTKPIITTDASAGCTGTTRTVDYYIVEPHEGTRVAAELHLPAGGAFGEPFTFPEGTPPAVTIHPYGKGLVIYVASHPWERYLSRSLKEQRDLVIGLVDHALQGKPILSSDAPPGVYFNLTEDRNGKYLHILNYCGTMLERSAAIEWIAPLHDVPFRIRNDQPFARIETVFDRATVSVEESSDYYTLTLSRLETHQTIRLLYG